MADKRKFLDVWIVESNTVYREVPYTVVADWVQEGRLLENDMLRSSGTAEWFPVSTMSAFSAYLPKPERFRTEDQAEALEPVQVEFGWKPAEDDGDEDVDMIPLIDVSLVLLIFFMMTATVTGSGSLFNTPEAKHGVEVLNNPQMLWIGIQRRANGTANYSIGRADQTPENEDQNLSQDEVLRRLDAYLAKGRADITVKGDREFPYNTVIKPLVIALERRRSQGVLRSYAGVTERSEP